MKLKIDTVGYDTKPKEFTTINNRLATIPAQEIDFETFCDLVGNKGHAFCVSDFIENTRNKCTRSFSRADIDNDPDVFENIKKENPDTDNIITFFKYKNKANDCPLQFGNTEGLDFMRIHHNINLFLSQIIKGNTFW